MTPTFTPAQQAEGKVRLATARLAGRYPFHARVLEQFRARAAPGVGTMGVTVDGADLLLLHAPDFVLKTPADELAGVLLHEVNHCVLGHLLTDPADFADAWARTVAEEITANEFVKEPLPEGAITLGLFPRFPPGESTAERYERLRKRKKRFPAGPPQAGPAAGSAPAGAGQDGSSTQAGGPPAAATGAGQDAPGPPGPGAAGEPRTTLDDHGVWKQARQDPEAAREAIRAALQQAALEAGTAALPAALQAALQAQGVGQGAGAEEYRIRHDRQGRLDWRVLLRRHAGQVLEPQPVLHRPPRRFPHLTGVVPARARRPLRPRVLAVLDTSGSITDELLEQIDGELRRLAAGHAVTVAECDDEVHKVYPYRRLERVAGRGGTDLRPPLEAAFLRAQRPDLVVYFTDGDGPAPAEAPRVPVVWCLVPGGEPPAPWGHVIRMED